MKAKLFITGLLAFIVSPALTFAQSSGTEVKSMQQILVTLKDEMIPLCEGMIAVAQGIAGFAALFYISSRVWKHIMNAEPIDFYPLFRPFVIGFCISAWVPLVLGVLDGILQPTVDGTSELVNNSDKAIRVLLEEKKKAIKESPLYQMYVGANKEGDREKWYKYTHNGKSSESENVFDAIGNDLRFELAKGTYRMQNMVKEWMSEILSVIFQAASLCINTLRTFQLVVLSILGPLVFGLAVFDGLQHTLTAWISKYINVYLWLPVANIFGAIIGKIQEILIKQDISQIQMTGGTYFSASDTGYIVFLLIGIVGYFTVPSVSNFIVNAGGGGGLIQKVTSLTSAAPGMAMAAGGKIGGAADTIANMRQNVQEGISGKASGDGVAGALGRAIGREYMRNKLQG